MKNLVLVESPSKARTISKFLDSGYEIIATLGHVRDLPSKPGMVDPNQEFTMHWSPNEKAQKQLGIIKNAAKHAEALFLATDPDREGEAIAWHVLEMLNTKPKIIHRIAFHEITKNAILNALQNPRQINQKLVNAYRARRALDYLVGFHLSPVLWRKLGNRARSAGRVQSVALRLVCDRETEIDQFKPRDYWEIHAQLKTPNGDPFTAKLDKIDGKKLSKFTLDSEEAAQQAQKRTQQCQYYELTSLETKDKKRWPAPPFITSSLQQEASRRFRFPASKTMRIAQKLYEGIPIGSETTGLITYMRTDSIAMSNQAITQQRQQIEKGFGKQYLPETPHRFKNTTRNAQEAHEAIRPTNFQRTPQHLKPYLDNDSFRLYELVWKRAVACGMKPALFKQTRAELNGKSDSLSLRASGQILIFDGFLKLYREATHESDGTKIDTDNNAENNSETNAETSADNSAETNTQNAKSQADKDSDNASAKEDKDDEDRELPPLEQGMVVELTKTRLDHHQTKPPPRYTDASLIKRMEMLGIGRPSTYASILDVLRRRDYVDSEEKTRFIPTRIGRVMTQFLDLYFEKYVSDDFTASMEGDLDKIAGGNAQWTQILDEFWKNFSQAIGTAQDTETQDIMQRIVENLEFLKKAAGTCPQCQVGALNLRTSKFGLFIGCDRYPNCQYKASLDADETQTNPQHNGSITLPLELGADPKTQEKITLRKGPYGLYFQRGDGTKPKRAGLPKTMTIDDGANLDIALKYLSLPRLICQHPETQQPIQAGLGPYGPYLLYQKQFYNLKLDSEGEIFDIGANRAVELINQKQQARGGTIIGKHPDGGDITLHDGRYGPYVKHGKLNASLPKGETTTTLEQAVSLLEQRKNAPAKYRARKTTKRKT